MVSEVFAGISAFKTMFDMAKAFKEMDAANTRNLAVMDLQQRILDAQAAYSTLTSRISELEAEVRRFETWEAEKQRYELHEIEPRRFTYRLKEAMAAGEPAHEICAQCFQRGIKSILQGRMERVGRMHMLTCHSCKSELNLSMA